MEIAVIRWSNFSINFPVKIPDTEERFLKGQSLLSSGLQHLSFLVCIIPVLGTQISFFCSLPPSTPTLKNNGLLLSNAPLLKRYEIQSADDTERAV